MKKMIFALAVLAGFGSSALHAVSHDHPELDPADVAYSSENYEKAAALYRKDAELGVIAAQVNLAILYMEGQGVPQDYQQAAKWFRQAADQGNAEAQQNLGLLYQEGKGVPQDLVESLKWFTVAGSGANMASVERAMTPQQIAEGRKRANDWIVNFKKAKQ